MKSMPCLSRLAADFAESNSKSMRYRNYTTTAGQAVLAEGVCAEPGTSAGGVMRGVPADGRGAALRELFRKHI